jgi:LmbE family N-acetylglucosaminyl deacetylase
MDRFKIIIIPIIILSVLILAFFYTGLPLSASNYPQGPAIGEGDRILVVAPHPDDETIATAGLIKNSTDNNISVKVVVMTDGDSYHSMAATRYNETQKAAGLLGLKKDDVILLGFPDGSLYTLFNINWNSEQAFSRDNGETHIHYPYVYKPDQIISGENLAKDLEEIITNFKPTIIIGPDGEDQQIDHKATQAFLEYATSKSNYTGKRYNYLIHLPPSWPYPRSYYPEYYLLPPKELTQDTMWVSFPLNITQEQYKELALRTYSSQVPGDSYLFSFIRKNEIFSQYPSLQLNQEGNLKINDTIQEDKAQNANPSMDIKSMLLDSNPDGLYLYIYTMQPIKKEDIFKFKLITSDGSTKRLDIQVTDSKAEVQIPTKNSVNSTVKVNIDQNAMLLIIPPDFLQNSNFLLLSAETTDGKRSIDQTRWYTINLQK